MNVFDLFAKLSLDKTEYDKGLDDAEKSGSNFSSKLKTAAKVGGAAMTALGAASVAVGKSFVNNANEVAQYGDNIDKMSQKMGISAEAYQEWDFIAQHSGTTMEALKPSFKTLAKAAQDGKGAFEELGLSLEEVQSMSTEDLFGEVVGRLQDMEAGTKRTALASELLGRGSVELGALFNQSAEETEAMKQQVHDLGGVMSDEAVKAAANYQDSLQNMQYAMSGLKNNMMGQLLPALSQVTTGLSKVFSGNYEEGLAEIEKGINGVTEKITGMLPKIVEVGGRIITSLATALVKNLPTLLPALVKTVSTIAQMLLQNMPLIIESAIQIVTQLAIALPTIIPPLVDAMIDALPLIIDAIIGGLMAALPQLIAGLVKLVAEIVKRLPTITKALIGAIPRIISDIVGAFASLPDKMLEIGSNMADSIKKGIREKWDNMLKWLSDKAASLPKAVKKVLGIASPSKVFAQIGQFMAEGLEEGFVDEMGGVQDAITNSMDFGTASITGEIPTASASSNNIVMNIYGAEGQDVQELADIIEQRLANKMYRSGAVYG